MRTYVCYLRTAESASTHVSAIISTIRRRIAEPAALFRIHVARTRSVAHPGRSAPISESKQGKTTAIEPVAIVDEEVLRGGLATRQSKALIRLFKRLKDQVVEGQGLVGYREYLQLSVKAAGGTRRF